MELRNGLSLSEHAYATLEELIVTLRLEPGGAVNEAALATELEMSRTPIREALIRLEREQLVSIYPRRGIIVSQISATDYKDLLATRRALDRLLVATAARRAEPRHLEALGACARDMEDAAADDAIEAFMAQDREFDRIVIEAARNRSASAAVMPLHVHCRRFWYANRGCGDLAESARRHADIMRAILRRDADEAGACSDRLIDYLTEMLEASLAA